MPSDKKIELDERYPSPLCMLSRGRVSPNLYSLQISPRQTRLYRNGKFLYCFTAKCGRVQQTSSVSRRFILPALRKGKATHAHQLPAPESSDGPLSTNPPQPADATASSTPRSSCPALDLLQRCAPHARLHHTHHTHLAAVPCSPPSCRIILSQHSGPLPRPPPITASELPQSLSNTA